MPRGGGGEAGAGRWAEPLPQEARPTYPSRGHQSAENSRGHCPGARQPGAKGNRPSPTPSGRPAPRRGHHRVPRGTHRMQRPATRREAGIPGESQSLLLPPRHPAQACRVCARGQGLQPLPPSPATARARTPRALPHFTLAQLLSYTIASQLQGQPAQLRGAGARPRPLRALAGTAGCAPRSPAHGLLGLQGGPVRGAGARATSVPAEAPFPACSPTLARSSTSAGLARSDTGDPAPPGPSAGREDLTVGLGSKEGETSQGRVALPAVPGLPGDVP